MKDQLDVQEQEAKDRSQQARRNRQMDWLKIAAAVMDAASRFLKP